MRFGHVIFLLALTLLTIGVVMVNSAGLTIEAEETISLEGVIFGRHALLAALAVAAMVVAMYLPVERLPQLRGAASPVPWMALGVIVLLLAVYLPEIGRPVNGARRWLHLGFVSFQPSELAKWLLPVVIAWHCVRRAAVLQNLRHGFGPPMLFAALVCGIVAIEDLGTAVLMMTVCVLMLLAAGCRPLHVAIAAAPGLAAATLLVLISPYRVARILAYLAPFEDSQGRGYHLIQSMAAVGGGGLAGRGLGNSIRKFEYLPEDTTDFIFAIVCEELGALGGLAVIGLYVALLIFGLLVVRRLRTAFGRLLGLGIILTIGLQAFINLAVVTGLAPTKGIALPLLSAGGTGWVMTAFALGLLIAMDRAAELDAASRPQRADASTESQGVRSHFDDGRLPPVAPVATAT